MKAGSRSGLEHIDSYYAASLGNLIDFPPLTDIVRCDVCVVGGGFTGLSTTLNLSESQFDTVLLEANRVGWGASGRNGGQLGSGFNSSQVELEKIFGRQRAAFYWRICEEAKREVLNRIKKHQIDCEFNFGVVGAAMTQKAAKQFQEEVDHLRIHYDYESVQYLSQSEIQQLLGTERYCAGRYDLGAGHLHPLKYAIGLAKAASDNNARIFEGTAVESYKKAGSEFEIKTDAGVSVIAKHIVFACNAYIGKLSSSISQWIMPMQSFIIATEPLSEQTARNINCENVAVYDSRFSLDYFRLSADRRLLFGGGEKYLRTSTADITKIVRPRMLSVYPKLKNVRIDYAWEGQIALTLNRLPSVGQLEKNVFYAQGYSGHGVALTNIVGKALSEKIAGFSDRYSAFAEIPHSTFPGGRYFRWPMFFLGMLYYVARDRISVLTDQSGS